MLASTMGRQPYSTSQVSLDSSNMTFGNMLLHGLINLDGGGDLEMSCRAANVLVHILKDNSQCKEWVLQIEFDGPVPSLGSSEPLLHNIVKYLALAASISGKDNGHKSTKHDEASYLEALFLRLLIIWLADCPTAVDCMLDSTAHLTYLLELVSNPNVSICVRGLVSVMLGECVIYNNKNGEGTKDSFAVVDAITKKMELSAYFMNFNEMDKIFMPILTAAVDQDKPLTRSSVLATADLESSVKNNVTEQQHEHPIIVAVFDVQFVDFIKKLIIDIRENIVDVFSHPKIKVAVIPADLEQKDSESNDDYVTRLKLFVHKQCNEMQDLLGRNATLAGDLANTGGGETRSDHDEKPNIGREKVQIESLRRELQEATQRVEALKAEKAKIEAEAIMYRNSTGKMESELKSLSDAYNSLEQASFRQDSELKSLRKVGDEPYPDIEAIKEEAREEAQKESEAELTDLFVCLGQEQSKVEKLSKRLLELGENVDSLLDGIGDETGGIRDEEDE